MQQNWKGLAPSAKLLQQYKDKQINEANFKTTYLNELENKYGERKQDMVNYLKDISQEQDVILCCYEKTGNFCHRYILADWLRPELNIIELEN